MATHMLLVKNARGDRYNLNVPSLRLYKAMDDLETDANTTVRSSKTGLKNNQVSL